MAKTAWQRAVGTQLRKGLTFPQAVKEAKRSYRGGARKRKRNPWVGGYSYTKPATKQKRVTVKRYWRRKKGTPKTRVGLTYKNNPKRRRAPRRRRNPAFTYTLPPVLANPRRRAPRRRSSRRRRNPAFTYTLPPVLANPRRRRYRRNPMSLGSFMRNPVAATTNLKDFALGFTKADFLMDTALPVGAGFLGTKLIAGWAIPKFFKPKDLADTKKVERWNTILKWKPALEVGLGIASGAAIGMITKKPQFAVKWVTGSLIAAVASLLDKQEFYKKHAVEPFKGIGESKSELAQAVKREIAKAEAGMQGMGYDWEEDEDEGDMEEYATVNEYATSDDMAGETGQGAYLTEDDLETSRSAKGQTFDDFAGIPNGF